MYRNKKTLYRLMGGDFSSNINQTLDEFLSKVSPTSDAALLIEEWKKGGISGNTTINSLLGTSAYYGILNESLRTVNSVFRIENHNSVSNEFNDFVDPKLEGVGGGSTTGEYRMSQFADTIITKTDFDESIVGKFYDRNVDKTLFLGVIIELDNGNLAQISYNQSVLENGIFIYEAYDLNTTDLIDGYWVAFQQDPNNPERLIKVGELQMTAQFWDNWYNWTAKDSGPNSVKFVSAVTNGGENDSIESYITKLTWTGSELVAEDIYFDFGGETFGSLYSDLTGISLDKPSFTFKQAEWILDDDYYGMAMGAEAGWCFYRNTDGLTDEEKWIAVGYNILTSEVKWVNPTPLILTLTNLDLLGFLKIKDWVNHPGGLVYSFDDNKQSDQGDNNNGVTAIWSPYWENNTECIYIGIRTQYGMFSVAERIFLKGELNSPFYWDNKAFYFWTESGGYNDQVYIVHKYHIETKEVTTYTLPSLTFLDAYSQSIESNFLNSWANNDGLFFNVVTFSQLSSWSIEKYQYVKHEDSKIYKFHLDMSYPTHTFKDKIYNINTMASYNFDTLGVAISTYKNMKF